MYVHIGEYLFSFSLKRKKEKHVGGGGGGGGGTDVIGVKERGLGVTATEHLKAKIPR